MPAARSSVAVDGHQGAVRYLGKNPRRRITRTLFPQAYLCRLWISLWKTNGQNVTDFFSCTPGGLRVHRSDPALRVARPGCPHRNPLTAHNLATGSQHVIHRTVLAVTARA